MISTSTAGCTRGALPLPRGLWLLDQMHSAVTFSVRHLGLSKVRGRFDEVTATLEVGKRPDDVRVEATIQMASVNTNNSDRDNHLRSTDVFDVDSNPTMTFRSTNVTCSDGKWTLEGNLTVNGLTKPVSWPVSFNGVNCLGYVPHAGFEVEGQLSRRAFGVDFGLSGVENVVVADSVSFELDLQFVEAPDDAA